MNARKKQRPMLPHEELAAQQPLAKPQYREQAGPVDTSALPLRKIHPERNRKFLDWLQRRPCVIAGMTNTRTDIKHTCWSPTVLPNGRYLSDPMHTGKAYSGKLKRSDRGAIPGCRHAHREQEPNMDRFDSDYGIDRHALAESYYAQFEAERGGAQ